MKFIRGQQDFWSGILFITVGAATVYFGSKYAMGTAARMGPGYFPRALGVLLMFLGALSVLRSFRSPSGVITGWRWRPIIVVLGSVVIFGLMVQHVGLALSTIFLVFASAAASHEFRPKEAAVAGVAMAILCVAVFAYALGIQLPIWPAFN
ncbi:MAG: tripartite tricarboxylate transporter TctB family protein [Casimicrobiaceae bacterium]